MNRILLILLMVISLDTLGQEWQEVQIDSTLTIMLPADHQIRDTLGQRVVDAATEGGLILISVVSDASTGVDNIWSESQLIKFYEDFAKSSVEQQQGDLLKQEAIDWHGVKIFRIMYTAPWEGKPQNRHCVTAVMNHHIYNIFFWEMEPVSEKTAEVREKLFSSLKFPPGVTMADQKGVNIDWESLLGFVTGQLLIVGMVAGVVWFFIRRSRRNRVVRKNDH